MARYKDEPQTLTCEVHFLAGSGAACGAVASVAASDLACFAAQPRVRLLTGSLVGEVSWGDPHVPSGRDL